MFNQSVESTGGSRSDSDGLRDPGAAASRGSSFSFTMPRILIALLAAALCAVSACRRAKEPSTACVRTMCAFANAARNWADDAGGRFPTNIT